MKEPTAIVVFKDGQIRRHWDEKRQCWLFSVVDVIAVLTDSENPAVYWRVLKKRLKDEHSDQTVTNCNGLKMPAADGKMRLTDMADTETMFRLIQSIPSPKAEPFKRWLAKVGYERVQEIENPELAQQRMKQLYEQKGYPKNWVDKRLRGIAIRQNLADEWKDRGIDSEVDYAILTAEISNATFGVTPSQYKKIKGLSKPSQNLRDHMTDLELIFTMLGEKVTTEISQNEQPETFHKSKKVAKRGGAVAGKARKATEKELKRPVVSRQNYLPEKSPKLLEDQ